jgi:protein-disulfide isomerase
MKTIVLLIASVAVFAQQVKTTPAPPSKSALDKTAMEAYLRHLELWVPQVEVKIDDAKPAKDLPGFFDVWVHLSFNGGTKDQQYYVSQDGKKILKGEVFEINKSPFQANLDKLKIDHQPTLGKAGAQVNMVLFSDFQCPICKEEAQILRANLLKTFPDKVHVDFVDYPLDSIHNWAHSAALAGRCVYKQSPEAFWNYFDWVYDHQGEIAADSFNSKFQIFATESKLDGMALGRCVEGKTTEPELAREIALAKTLQVSATPTTFMNGRKLEGGLPWATLEQLINIELEHQAAAAKAADDACCTVQIPKIVK